MGLFNFLKGKSETEDIRFLGRHQLIQVVKELLGENITNMEMQIATNKDLSERNEIVNKLEDIEGYMHSDFYTSVLDVGTTNEDIKKVIETGYKNCVLQNDRNLELRVLAIYENVIEYTKKIAKSKGVTDRELSELEEILDSKALSGIISYMTLGGLIKSVDEQSAWWIMSSLNEPNKRIGNFDSSDLITGTLSMLSKVEDVESTASDLQKMKVQLLKNGKMSVSESQKVEKMIIKGVKRNQEIHKINV